MGAAYSTAAAKRELNSILVLAQPLADEHRARLEAAGFTNIVNIPDRTVQPTPEQLADAHILYGFVQQAKLETVDQVPNLRFIQLKSAGAESVVDLPFWKDDRAAAIGLTTAAGVHTGPIPQYFIATTLVLFHRLQQQILLSQVEKRWGTNDDLGGGLFIQEFRGKTVGVLGYGHIGREAARLSAAFGATVIAANTTGTKKLQDGYIIPGTGDPEGNIPSAYYSTADPASLAKFLQQVDVVLLSLPSTPATQHILNAETIAHLKPTAIVVNVGRGDAIDTPALVAALDAEKLGGAALDVTEPEPLPNGHTLFGRPNVLVTPHCSGRTIKYDDLALDILLANVERWRKGESLLNAVDPRRGY